MSDISPLNSKVVWLTGASSGIGEAFARAVARRGCKLAITARRQEVLERLADEIRAQGGNVFVAAGDVTDINQMARVASSIQQELGPIDVLVANAGNHVPTDILRFDVAEYESIFQINFFGAVNCIQQVLPSMIERRSGHVVGVSSVAGYRGLPKAAAYGASKSAFTHFLESIRFDLAKYQVDVSVVSPGFVRTPLTDKNDFPMPFLMEADKAALAMVSGVERRQLEVHFPKRFTFLLKLARVLPYPLYHKLILSTVAKA